MNKDRRKQIDAVIEQITALDAKVAELREAAEALRDDVDSIRSDEQDYFDNMPESMQSGEKGERAEAAVNYLQIAYDALEELASTLGEFSVESINSDLEAAKE